MKKTERIFTITLTVLLAAFVITGCKKNKKVPADPDTLIKLEIQDSSEQDIFEKAIQYWHVTDQKVCVMLGYDFNSAETVEEYRTLFQERYGLAEDGGLIMLLTYPDSFKHGARAYVNDFSSILNAPETDLCGLLLLGAPEKTHLALAKMQDFWEQNVPYPVFALFPQDEVLGLESTCDFVLDKSQEADMTGTVLEEETASVISEQTPQIVIQCIDYMLAQKSPFAKDLSITKHTEQMLSGHQISHYIDPETGIQSINHFILN